MSFHINLMKKLIRKTNKEIGVKPENCNLGIRLAMGASKYMMALAYLDMMACIYNVKDAKSLFNFPSAFEKIVQQRSRRNLFQIKTMLGFAFGRCIFPQGSMVKNDRTEHDELLLIDSQTDCSIRY